MILPRVGNAFNRLTEEERNRQISLADRQNHKRGRDVEIGAGRLILTDSATSTRYQVGIEYGALVVKTLAGVDVSVDALIRQAERTVLSTYGDTVSVAAKAKGLNKFGYNIAVGTSFETVGQFQGTTSDETFATTNSIDRIVSDSTTNNGTILVLEGHTIDGSGNLTFATQEVTLATPATTPVTLGTPLARASRMYPKASGTFNSPQTDIAGNVYVYDNTVATGVTSGVPDVASATKLMMVAENQTQKCATSISSGDYWFISSINAGIGSAGGSANRVRVRVETRDVVNGGVWRPIGRDLTIDVDQNGVQKEEIPFLIVPKNHDVRARARTDSNSASIFCEIRGFLAAVQT